MGKHGKSVRRRLPAVTTGLAIPAVSLLGFVHATDAHFVGIDRTASTTIFVDGTKSITGTEEDNPPFRMVDSFMGAYAQPNADDNSFVFYPRSLGPVTGVGDPTYDVSEGLGTDQVVALVRQAKQDPDYHPGDLIYVVGYSQGAGAAVNAIPELETDEFASENIEFVLAANPRRNDGGILTRLPKGVYLPVFGVTFGGGTATDSTKVLQVTKAYDGVGDAPDFVLNIAADLNAVLGYYYLHPGYYRTVDPNDPTAIVTTSADGNVTDVLIPAKLGELPLTLPLLQLGVPRNLVEALDPFLRAVIETGYERPPDGGTFASEPVPFRLVPPPTRWLSDAQSVASGAAQSAQALAGVAPSAPSPSSNGPGLASSPPTLASSPPTLALNTESTAVPGSSAVPGSTAVPEPAAEAIQSTKSVDGGAGDAGIEKVKPDPPTSLDDGGASKFEPPKMPTSGWKPGALLRSSLAPQPSVGSSETRQDTTQPHQPSATSASPASSPGASPAATPGAAGRPSGDAGHTPAA